VRTGQCEMKLDNESSGVNAVKFMAGGEMLAAAGSDGMVSEGQEMPVAPGTPVAVAKNKDR